MKKIEKKVITHVAYANVRELKVVTDANGNNVNTFSYDEIVFSEDKETVLEFNTKTIENVNDEYKNKFTKIVASDLNGLLSKEAKIKEFKEEQSKIKKIESKNKVKNLVFAKDQPKKSHLVRNTLVAGAVVTLLYFGGKYVADNTNKNNGSLPGNTDGEVEEVVEIDEVFEEVVITKEMFVEKQVEVLSLLESKGIKGLDAESVASALFLFNLENFDNEVISELKNDRIIDDNMEEILLESFRLSDTVTNRNSTIVESKNGLVTLDDLILTSDLMIGVSKDVRNLEYAENKLVEMINSEDKETNTEIYREAFRFILASLENNYPYTYADMTVSGKYALNLLTNKQLIMFSKDKLLSEEITNSMLNAEAYNGISDIQRLYGEKCGAIKQ